MKQSGIYTIQCVVSGNMYVGSSKDIKKRWTQHRTTLRAKKSHCPNLQRAWDKYGEEAFVFQILELVEQEYLLEREQYWIDTLRPAYNYSDSAFSPMRDPKVAKKVSIALTGKGLSEARRAQIRINQLNRELTPEWRENISLSMIDNPKVKGPKSEAHRESTRRVMKLQWEDPVYRARMVEARRNRKPSQSRSKESRDRSKQARTAAWQRQLAEGYTGPGRDVETGRFLKSS